MMTQSRAFARFYEVARDASEQPKLVANWLMGELSKRLNAKNLSIELCSIPAPIFGEIMKQLAAGEILANGARVLLDKVWEPQPPVGKFVLAGPQMIPPSGLDRSFVSGTPLALIAELIKSEGLAQLRDTGALEAIVNT